MVLTKYVKLRKFLYNRYHTQRHRRKKLECAPIVVSLILV
jgi:hypothetical protein